MTNIIKNVQDYFTKRQLQNQLTSLYSDFCKGNYVSVKQGIKVEEKLVKILKKAEVFNKNSNLSPIDTEKYREGILRGEFLLEETMFAI